jgi:hypothetical protein
VPFLFVLKGERVLQISSFGGWPTLYVPTTLSHGCPTLRAFRRVGTRDPSSHSGSDIRRVAQTTEVPQSIAVCAIEWVAMRPAILGRGVLSLHVPRSCIPCGHSTKVLFNPPLKCHKQC